MPLGLATCNRKPTAPAVTPQAGDASEDIAALPAPPIANKDFGRDKDLKALLKTLPPKAFTGEGANVPKMLEEWIMSMDDYFALAGYNALAQGLVGRAKFDGPAKLWWKLHCQSQDRIENTVGWDELRMILKERYLPLNYATKKMNEFLSCIRRGRSVDVYYEEFVSLSRHAPLMTEE